ncbi:hypothetical protein KKC44_06135 [Patescibacteria group bacterium]|nr:hypothetical protein [Patescibacteria group bacterium]MBU2260150.1 hypothetical protein [Patescibacteria group bacterium]
MPTLLQLTIEGKEEFVPPKVQYCKFIRHIDEVKPELLDAARHKELMIEFANHYGLHPEKWGASLPEIKWVLSCGFNVERARRSFCADAY